MCFEYTSHLYQSRRLDHGLLEAAINKFLAFDLIAESEVATVVFGQHYSRMENFQKLDAQLSSRFALFNPAIDPYDEPVQMFNAQELAQMDIQASSGQAKLIKGSCSLARMMAEVNALLQKSSQYDDVGADLIVITSGLFVEDEARIEEILRGSSFKSEHNRLQLIVYPSTMLFDTKSRDGFLVLDAIESEAIIRSRINKLLLIQRLTNGQIHLVKEQLDANGDVKVSTLVQFYQIFDHIAKGHSWDQTQAMALVDFKTVEARPLVSSASVNGSKLTYQFELDASIQSDLFVGLIDQKHPNSHAHRPGKRFSLKSLQLRSPAGQLVFTETHTWPQASTLASANATGSPAQPNGYQDSEPAATSSESAFFPYRAQLSLAAFHVKPWHLAQLNATGRLAGVWTLSAISEEPIQTSGVAMARVNPAGDTLTATCWIQTYYGSDQQDEPGASADAKTGPLKAVKVFVEARAGGQQAAPQELVARMEVQDQLGNIVQNVNMLDDGLGAPDITKGDGLWSQFVQRAYRPGFYKVTVELAGAAEPASRRPASQQQPQPAPTSQSGQDNVCCGSFIPAGAQQPDTRHLARQLYCGTFYVDTNNRLAEQRPPRVNNLTVVNVDHDQRRVTIRWFEPSIDISVHSSQSAPGSQLARPAANLVAGEPNNDLVADESQQAVAPDAGGRAHRRSLAASKSARRQIDDDEPDEQHDADVALGRAPSATGHHYQPARAIVMQAARAQGQQQQSPGAGQASQASLASSLAAADQLQAALSNRYEIKMFADRDMVRRAFDARHEVGFKFNEWNVEGAFPNASAYGGMKEVTLRIPHGREGIYFIAMRVYNNVGVASHVSNIAQFYIKNNLSLDETDPIYGQPTTMDADGNVYDKNGDLIQRANGSGQLNYSLLKATTTLDGLSVLILFSLLAFITSVLCVSLVACLASSARKSLAATRHHKADDKKAVAPGSVMTGAGSGSSMASSGCGSSQQSEVGSSAGGSQGGHDVDINKLSLGDELTYNNLHQQHQHQQHQAQLIHNQHMISASGNQAAAYQHQHQQPAQLQHTIVNGYTYATVNGFGMGQRHLEPPDEPQQQQQQLGDLNQNGLAVDEATMSPVQSWPADILLSHYDKVKQARERNEAPPVMRIETLEHGSAGQFLADGLPTVQDSSDHHHQQHLNQSQGQMTTGAPLESSYLVRNRQLPSYFNQQLQQQLTSVLKNKRQSNDSFEQSSPALEGVTGDLDLADEQVYGHRRHQMASEQQQPIAPPPPQYIYCSPAGATADQMSGLASQLTEPSIYSQTTSLQQVAPPAADHYYTNQQWPAAGQQPVYGQLDHQSYPHQHQAQPGGQPAGADFDKSNSAISEV